MHRRDLVAPAPIKNNNHSNLLYLFVLSFCDLQLSALFLSPFVSPHPQRHNRGERQGAAAKSRGVAISEAALGAISVHVRSIRCLMIAS